MNLETALEAFKDLEHYKRQEPPTEGLRESELEELPVYAVRFDASVNRDEDREFRLRVTRGAATVWKPTDDWRGVFDLARTYDLTAMIQNDGIELT